MDVIDFSAHRTAREAVKRRRNAVNVKEKLSYYRTIWNNSPRRSDLEQRSLAKIAMLVGELPDDDKEKIDYVRIAVDFYEQDENVNRNLLETLKQLVENVTDTEERLHNYRVIMRNKHSDEHTKEHIGNMMMDILETT